MVRFEGAIGHACHILGSVKYDSIRTTSTTPPKTLTVRYTFSLVRTVCSPIGHVLIDFYSIPPNIKQAYKRLGMCEVAN